MMQCMSILFTNGETMQIKSDKTILFGVKKNIAFIAEDASFQIVCKTSLKGVYKSVLRHVYFYFP